MAVAWEDPNTILINAWTDAARDCKIPLRDQNLNDTLSGDSLISLLEEVQEGIAKSARNPRKVKLLEKFAAFAQWLDRYARCIDTFVQASPEASIIWGSIRIILEFVVSRVNSLTKVVNVFTCILENFGRYELYQTLFAQDRNVQCVLALVYADIITFCAKTAAFYNARGFKASLKRTLASFESRYGGVVETFNRHRLLVEDTVRAAGHQRDYDAQARQQSEEQSQKSRAIRKWLSPTTREATYFESDHRAARKLRTLGTCSWLRKSRPFQQWLTSDQPVLLLTGNPGHGKTILLSDLIDNIFLQLPGSKVAYFYCKYQDTDKRTSLSLVKSLLLQLVDLGALSQYSWKLLSRLNEYSVQDSAHSDDLFGKLCNIFWQALDTSSQSIFVIIDALNECEDRKLFLEELRNYTRANPASTAKLIISCRVEPVIFEQLSDTDTQPNLLPVQREDTADDMLLYITTQISADRKMRAWPRPLKELVQNKLLARADGMFLWTKLMIGQIASQATLDAVEKALNDLPPDLPQTYLRILSNLQVGPYLKRILQWLCMSNRTLRAQELKLILEIAHSDTAYNSKRAILNDFSDVLGASCGPLVELHEEEVRFTHFTVKEFLLSESARDTPFGVKVVEAHNEIAATCLTYLSFVENPNYHEGIFCGFRNDVKIYQGVPRCTSHDTTQKTTTNIEARPSSHSDTSVRSHNIVSTGCVKDKDAIVEAFLATPNTAIFDYAVRYLAHHVFCIVKCDRPTPLVLKKLRELLFGRQCLTFIESTILLLGSAGPLVSKLQLAESVGKLGLERWISTARILLSEFDDFLRYYPGKIHSLSPSYFPADNPFHTMLLARPQAGMYNTGDISAIANQQNFGKVAILDPSRGHFFTIDKHCIQCRNLEDGLLLQEFFLDTDSVGTGNLGSSETIHVRMSSNRMYLAIYESKNQGTPNVAFVTHLLALHQTEENIFTRLWWTSSTEIEKYTFPQLKKKGLYPELCESNNISFSADSKVLFGPGSAINLENGAKSTVPFSPSGNVSSINFAQCAPVLVMVVDESSISIATLDREQLSSISFPTGFLVIKAVSSCGGLIAFIRFASNLEPHMTKSQPLFIYDWRKGSLIELPLLSEFLDSENGRRSHSGAVGSYPILFNGGSTRLLVALPDIRSSSHNSDQSLPLEQESARVQVRLFELVPRTQVLPQSKYFQNTEWQQVLCHELVIAEYMKKYIAVSFSKKEDHSEQIIVMTPHEIQSWTLRGSGTVGLSIKKSDVTPHSGLYKVNKSHAVDYPVVRTTTSLSRGKMAMLEMTGRMAGEQTTGNLKISQSDSNGIWRHAGGLSPNINRACRLRIYDLCYGVRLLRDFELQCSGHTSPFAISESGSKLVVGLNLVTITGEKTYKTRPMAEALEMCPINDATDEIERSERHKLMVEIEDLQFHPQGRFLGLSYQIASERSVGLCVFDVDAWRPAWSWSSRGSRVDSNAPNHLLFAFHPMLPEIVWEVGGLQVAICDFLSLEAPKLLPFTCDQPFPQQIPYTVDFKLRQLAFSTCGQFLMFRDVRLAGVKLFPLHENHRMYSTDFLPKDDAWSYHCTFSTAKEEGDDVASVFVTTAGPHGELFVSQRDLVRGRDRRVVLAGLPKSIAPEPSTSGIGSTISLGADKIQVIFCKDFPIMQPVVLSFRGIPWTAWEETPDRALYGSNTTKLDKGTTKILKASPQNMESQKGEALKRGRKRLDWEIQSYKTFMQDPKWLELARKQAGERVQGCTYDTLGFPSPELLNIIDSNTTTSQWSEQVGRRFEHIWHWQITKPGSEPLLGAWEGFISQTSRQRIEQLMSNTEMTPPFFGWDSFSGYRGTKRDLQMREDEM